MSKLYSKKTWAILNKSKKNVIDILLENRGQESTKEKAVFFKPINPKNISLKDLKISEKQIKKALIRIKKAKRLKEKIIVYGDYDADGVTATAIMWEALHKFGTDVMPYIPDRFSEGYGIKAESVEKFKNKPKVIVTVDNGIVANSEIKKIKEMGIDVIVTDHHSPGKSKPKAFAIIHTVKIAGSAVAWILARELGTNNGLELAAIGTISDQMPLVGPNRSFAKFGIEELRKTRRTGLIKLAENASLKLNEIGTYEINYMIAPRINSMGRLMHAIDSLRLLCTTNKKRAEELARLLSKTNLQRQKIVDEISIKVLRRAKNETTKGIIFIADKNYQEGVIGLAAGRLVEEFYRPAIVVSVGEKFSKGSARSISGFNIIKVIREHANLLVAHGGHVMAAGFTIESSKIEKFAKRLNISARKLLTKEILQRKLKIDCELNFDLINWEFSKKIKEFEPTGLGNPTPTFLTKNVEVIDSKLLGKDKNHLKLKLKKDDKFFDSIGFGMGSFFTEIKKETKIDLVYNIDENEWNGTKSLQLRIKDLKIS